MWAEQQEAVWLQQGKAGEFTVDKTVWGPSPRALTEENEGVLTGHSNNHCLSDVS